MTKQIKNSDKITEKLERICKNCSAFYPSVQNRGKCRKKPPVVAVNPIDGGGVTLFPSVINNEWCRDGYTEKLPEKPKPPKPQSEPVEEGF